MAHGLALLVGHTQARTNVIRTARGDQKVGAGRAQRGDHQYADEQRDTQNISDQDFLIVNSELYVYPAIRYLVLS